MTGKAITPREANHILHFNGFGRVRTKGDHAIYKHPDGRTITITLGKISQKTWKRECKKNQIIER